MRIGRIGRDKILFFPKKYEDTKENTGTKRKSLLFPLNFHIHFNV